MAKSVAKNAVYSGIRTISMMLFPLITYPYVTRVLLADNLGKVDFSVSIVSYFLLIAGLGVTTYATRNGAALRNDKTQLDQFASEVFTINMASTLVSYLLLALLVLLWPHLHGYLALIAIQSLTIIGTTMGVEWVYALEEDYGYITARTLFVQVLSTALLFLLVKRPSDYVIYAAITVLSGVGANVFNWFRARRYVSIRLVWGFDVQRHLVPMLILFGNAIAVTIYVNIDISLLNVMRGDYEVGIYGLSVKIYKMVKQLLNAVVAVSLPRLSLHASQHDRQSYDSLLLNMGHGLLVIVVPVLTLLFMLSRDVVLIVGGPSFLQATTSLRVLCLAGLFAVAGNFFVSAILLPFGGESRALQSTIIGAVINLLLNLAFIPTAGIVGAALTTVVAELCVAGSAAWFSRGFVNMGSLGRELLPALQTSSLGMATMLVSCLALSLLPLGWPWAFFVKGAGMSLGYLAILWLKKDTLFMQACSRLGLGMSVK